MSNFAWALLAEASVVCGLLLGWVALGYTRRRTDRIERERAESARSEMWQREGGIRVDLHPDDVLVSDNTIARIWTQHEPEPAA